MPEDIKVAIIAGAGDGRLPTTMHDATVPTPGSNPNLVVLVIQPLVALLIRAAHLFLITFVSTISAAGVTGDALIASTDVYDLAQKAAALAAITTGVSALKDLVTIFGRLESKFPLATGNV